MRPEPDRTSTPAGRLLLAATLFVVACGCTPATMLAATEAPFGDLGPATPDLLVESDARVEADARTAAAPAAGEHDGDADGPRAQSDEARAAAYQENFDAARRFKAADRAKYPHGHARRYRGHRGDGISIGKFALVAIIGIAVLRVLSAGRKPATPPPAVRPPAPAVITATPARPAALAAGREIISLACGRCDRVLDLPRDRARRRLFCPRCGAVMPSAEA